MAGRIPEQLIQDIIAANDIVGLVGQYVTLKRSGSSYVGLCPFHKEKTPSFHVTPDRQLYYCFGCGAGGNIVEFVKNMENLDFIESIRFLAERAGIQIDASNFSEEDKKQYEKKQRYLQLNKEAARFFREVLFSKNSQKAQVYIGKRKLTVETVKAYGLGYAPDDWNLLTNHLLKCGYKQDELVQAGVSSFTKTGKIIDRFRDRIMFPIIDIRGNVIGFGGRVLGDGNPKYLNSPDTPVFNKGRNLFSLQIARRSQELILVEGYMDVISLYQSGVQNAVASLGTALTVEQARLAAKYAEKVTVCYDTDAAGVKATMRAIEVFQGIDTKLRILSLPEGKDPDEFIKANGAEKFIALLKKAETPAGFQIIQLRKKYDLTDQTQKVEYIEACTKAISRVQSSIEREVLREKIAEETGIQSSAIKNDVEKTMAKKTKQDNWKVRNVVPVKPNGNKSLTSEKIVSLCLKDVALFRKNMNTLLEIIVNPLHKQILSYMDESDDAAQIINRFSDEDASGVAAALSMPVNYENNETALKELMESLKKEVYNQKIKEAIESGDLSTLNTLLMKKNANE